MLRKSRLVELEDDVVDCVEVPEATALLLPVELVVEPTTTLDFASRASSSSRAVGAWSHTATAVTEPSHVVS